MGNVADIFIWLKKRERWVKLVRNYAREVEKQVRMFSCTYDEKKEHVLEFRLLCEREKGMILKYQMARLFEHPGSFHTTPIPIL